MSKFAWLTMVPLQKQAEDEWREKLELERARTVNKIVPKTDYKELIQLLRYLHYSPSA